MFVGIATIPSKLNLSLLRPEFLKLDYHVDDGNVHMANGQGRGIPSWVKQAEIGKAVQEISLLRKLPPVNVMINILKPGAPVPKHRDFIPPTQLQHDKPCIERWHLAVATNPDCYWWDEKSGDVEFPEGFWSGPVPYWLQHTFVNNGKSDRLHLIVDLDTPVPMGKYVD